MNLSDPVLQKRILIVLLAAVIAYFFFGADFFPFCYRVKKAEITQLRQQVEEKERKIALSRSNAGRLEVLQQRLAELENDWRRMEQLLPRQDDIPEYVRQIARFAARAGVKVDFVQPGQTVPGLGIDSRTIEMRMHGDYHKVGDFLSLVANADRLIRTEGLVLKGLTETAARKNVEGGVKEGSVEASFKATLFMLGGGHEGK